VKLIFKLLRDKLEEKNAIKHKNISRGEWHMEIRRDFYLDKLIKRKHNGLIKVITGIKR